MSLKMLAGMGLVMLAAVAGRGFAEDKAGPQVVLGAKPEGAKMVEAEAGADGKIHLRGIL